jgi:hypothetical protein
MRPDGADAGALFAIRSHVRAETWEGIKTTIFGGVGIQQSEGASGAQQADIVGDW